MKLSMYTHPSRSSFQGFTLLPCCRRIRATSVAAHSVLAPPHFAQYDSNATVFQAIPSTTAKVPSSISIRDGLYPKKALSELYQKVMRGTPQLQYGTQACPLMNSIHRPWFACLLCTPAVNTTVNGRIIQIPEMVRITTTTPCALSPSYSIRQAP